MADHNTLIGSATGEIEGGTVLIGGVVREIDSGLVLVNGVAREIVFGSADCAITISRGSTAAGNLEFKDYSRVTIAGTTYNIGDVNRNDITVTVPSGTTITLAVSGLGTTAAYIKINGSNVVNSVSGGSKNFTVTKNVNIVLDLTTRDRVNYAGAITVTEK